MKRKADTQNNTISPKKRVKKRTVEKYRKIYHFTEKDRIARSLRTRGFAVVNVGKTSEQLAEIRRRIDIEIEDFREYAGDASSRSPLGGFAAYGNPSSFHNETVRGLRVESYKYIEGILDSLKPSESYLKEAIIDRLMVRPKGASPSAESWHRDEAVNALDDDIVLGGWWNFDDAPSYLSCVKGSHKGVHGHSGFARVSKEESAKFSAVNIHVEVPAGAILLFNEQLAHEVLGKKLSHKSYRLFLGWRITTSTVPLDKDLPQKLEKQSAIQIKSGQEPPMWAKLHWTNWVNKLADFSKNFDKKCVEKMTVKSGKNAGNVYDIVHRHMKSLEEYGYKKYPQYTPQETKILYPH